MVYLANPITSNSMSSMGCAVFKHFYAFYANLFCVNQMAIGKNREWIKKKCHPSDYFSLFETIYGIRF